MFSYKYFMILELCLFLKIQNIYYLIEKEPPKSLLILFVVFEKYVFIEINNIIKKNWFNFT